MKSKAKSNIRETFVATTATTVIRFSVLCNPKSSTMIVKKKKKKAISSIY